VQALLLTKKKKGMVPSQWKKISGERQKRKSRPLALEGKTYLEKTKRWAKKERG